ncbi:tRNA uridine-5-carboxymethylaminomethyl(34) synthesis GTPase MnmE [Fusobacterium sp. PH5-44]|uniref:tRNA uridine-5-carboxymethylaminomethyl(34) synthesis GTPase MnmE n=1 Tax=unclassified Fusobacterium TaxID=2648384 RepID=UPI003D1A48D0
MLYDTIAAISTPVGEGGIGIIRISGNDSLSILDKIFIAKSQKKSNELRNFSINYGHIQDEGKILDQVLVSVMKGKNTFTGENIVEINCHGGYYLLNNILQLILEKGARLAEKGEFTRRAFLNGKIDLTQAESILDLIEGKNKKILDISINNLRGDLKKKVDHLKKLILDVAAHINVVLDYPEEGIDDPIPEELVENLKIVYNVVNNLIDSYEKGKIIKNGIKTAIIGKPNVGKSSILNSLLRSERAIVTHIPGTTRDIIEESINIKGINLSLIDTAGIRDTDDIVENIGVEKSKELLNEADLILFVVDNSELLDENDKIIYDLLDKEKITKTIGILNKIDKEEKINIDLFSGIEKWFKISALNKSGIDEMEDEIYNYIIKEKIQNGQNNIIITNVRHKASLEKTKVAVKNLLETISMGLPMDLLAVDIKEGLDSLGEITGEITSEDLLDHIFANFCVGK